MTDTTDPVDPLHRECLEARRDIHAAFRQAQAAAVAWTPKPMPADWHPNTTM